MHPVKSKCYHWSLPWLMLGAVLTALTLVVPEIGLLEWLSLALMLFGVLRLFENRACTARKAYAYGFLTVYVYYFIIYHWIVNLYPLDFVGLDEASSLVVVLVGWFGLPILQAVLGGFVFLLYRLIERGEVASRLPILKPFAFAALWMIFEWCSTLGWMGVPWGRLALGQIKMLPMVQSASLLGSYFVGFLMLSVAGLLAQAVINRPKAMLCGVLAGSIFAANLVFGVLSCLVPRQSNETVRVAVLQANINSHEKWAANSAQRTRETYAKLTRAAVADGAELVVMPETAFPYDLSVKGTTRTFLCDLAKECGVPLIVGALASDEFDHTYNSMFLIEPDGSFREEFYSKRHLVPFGEYVPMRELILLLFPPLADMSALDDDLTPGPDSALFETEWGKIGSLICFDSIYETLTLESVRDGADLMLIASNDSWFFDSAGVYQHQAQAQLRAVESGRYVVRAANTGISTILSPTGEILEWIDPLTEGYAVADVGMRSQKTLYDCVGNFFIYLCIAGVVAMPIAGVIWKKKQTET